MSIESRIAAAVYLVAITPDALAKVVADPDMLLRSVVAEWPNATVQEIERGYLIADELLKPIFARCPDPRTRRKATPSAQSKPPRNRCDGSGSGALRSPMRRRNAVKPIACWAARTGMRSACADC